MGAPRLGWVTAVAAIIIAAAAGLQASVTAEDAASAELATVAEATPGGDPSPDDIVWD